MLEIVGKAQNYDWGKLGGESEVAALAKRNGLAVKEETPYAELWMGTHPSGPSHLLKGKNDEPLKQYVTEKSCSKGIWEKFEGDLPFLLKVLSIRKALSIQAHPDKILASRLHKEFPNIYKDPNHKPEMAVALTPFEAFIGFRPLEEIAENIKLYPEFSGILGEAGNTFLSTVGKNKGKGNGEASVKENKAVLKSIFSALQNTPQPKITEAIRSLITRISSSSPSKQDQLLVRLDSQFPDDVGTFCALMLNYVSLLAGEAIFLAANEPHAYLSGDCVECMAASDNVVRSGLTPKFKDVPTLVEMLTYNYGGADAQILRGTSFSKETKFTREYNPPIEEFSILQTTLAKEGEVEEIKGLAGPSILICVDGEGSIEASDDLEEGGEKAKVAGKGSIFFLGAGISCKMTATSSNFIIYRAFCEL